MSNADGSYWLQIMLFFVWTSDANVIDEIIFDAEYWDKLKTFVCIFLQELLTINLHVCHIFLLYLLTKLRIFKNKQLFL